MTSGAKNSGVPKLTFSFSLGLYLLKKKEREAKTLREGMNKYLSAIAGGSYRLARPKSMILILFVALLTHRIFSG